MTLAVAAVAVRLGLRSQPRVRAWPGRPVRQILARKTGKANLARKARMTGKANSRAWRPLHVRIRVVPAVRTGWRLFLIQKGLRNRPFLRAGYPPPTKGGGPNERPVLRPVLLFPDISSRGRRPLEAEDILVTLAVVTGSEAPGTRSHCGDTTAGAKESASASAGIQGLPGKVSADLLCPCLHVRSQRRTRSADLLSC